MYVIRENLCEDGMKEKEIGRNADEKVCKTKRKINTIVSNKGRGEK
jgi:hypothetical protein